jgi:hypothetical protein
VAINLRDLTIPAGPDCELLGKVRTFLYCLAFTYVIQLGALMNEYLRNPTMNQLKYLTRLHLGNLLSSTVFTVLAGYYFGFGVQMNLACGISSHQNRWSGLFMSYPLLLLPFVVYNYFKLQQIPALFKSTVRISHYRFPPSSSSITFTSASTTCTSWRSLQSECCSCFRKNRSHRLEW